jgi:hypothetical protein
MFTVLTSEGNYFLASIVRPARFVVVLAAGALALFLSCDLAGRLDHPTVTVGVVSRLVRGAMYLARPIQDFIECGRAVPVPFRGFLPLTGFGVTESGIHCHILGFAAVMRALIFVAPWFPISIPDFRGTGVFWVVASTSQPTIFACAKAGHE